MWVGVWVWEASRDEGWGRGEEALALSDQGQEAGEGGESASRTQLLLLRKGPAASCPDLGHQHWWREGVQAAGAETRTSVELTRWHPGPLWIDLSNQPTAKQKKQQIHVKISCSLICLPLCTQINMQAWQTFVKNHMENVFQKFTFEWSLYLSTACDKHYSHSMCWSKSPLSSFWYDTSFPLRLSHAEIWMMRLSGRCCM